MGRADDAARLAQMLAMARAETTRSQEYMALELGVSKKTVRNWETGITSPTVFQMFEWFRVLGVNPTPYLFQYIHPTMFGIKGSDEDEKITESLFEIIKDLPIESKRELLYILYGDHGGSPKAVLDMVTAHLQTPMKDRVQTASAVAQNYILAKNRGEIAHPTHIQPNVESLRDAVRKGFNAASDKESGYAL